MEGGYQYSLRIGIDPEFDADDKFQILLDFCKKAKIDDIQFFLNMEELNQGHLSPEETEKWLSMIGKMKPEAEKSGFTVSLNPWTTVLHEDRGRKLRPEQHFTTMEDCRGNKAQAVACPLDEEFRAYIRQIYGMYAKLHFRIIWAEDDFRLHNHPPLEWGGCFCRLHREEFSKRAGREVTLSEIREGFSKTGEPSPYRKLWLDTARDTMIGFAKLLGEAVHDAAPETRVGLMSSGPETHCAEGRDWHSVLHGLAGSTRPLNRPHLPAYHDVSPIRYALDFQRFPRLTAAMAGEETELWPELENYPHTRFSKSLTFSRLQMESTLSLCAEGITLNLFDMAGNGVNPVQQYDSVLSKIKPYLTGVVGLGLRRSQEQGVYVLYSSRSSYTVHSSGGDTPQAICPRETFWAEYLAAFGIAYRYCDDLKISGKIVAVSGQYFRNLSPEQIETLFANNALLLDGEAVSILFEMGLQKLIQAEKMEWIPCNTGVHSYEQVCNGKQYQGLPSARMSTQTCSSRVEPTDYLCIQYDDNSCRETVSRVKTPGGKEVGEGVVCLDNRVVIFPFGHMTGQYDTLLNSVRQEILQEALLAMNCQSAPAMVYGCPYVTVNEFALEGKKVLLLTNYSNDAYENPKVLLDVPPAAVEEIGRDDGVQRETSSLIQGKELVLQTVLEPLTSRCFIIKF